MAIHGFNLDQTRSFEKEIKRLRSALKCDPLFKQKILENENEYSGIKSFFSDHLEFLRYTFEVEIDTLYRVRRLDNASPFTERHELIYPEASIVHKDRMNNMSSRVLYVSLHEYTAMAEVRLNEDEINSFFQLTKFLANEKFTVFKLGQFSEYYKNMPRDSDLIKKMMIEWFGDASHDRTVRGYAALECAIVDILYDQEDDYHILSSIMADAIFSVNSSIEAIIYPSVQNHYGTNLAIKKELADKLEIRGSYVNQLIDVYSNGFFKYQTISELTKCNDQGSLEFSDVNDGFWKSTYR